MRWMRTLAVLLLAAVVSVTAPGCQTNPATGKTDFNLLGQADEVRIGSQAAPQFVSENGGEVPSPAVVNYVRDMGARLTAKGVNERPDLPWEFHVLDTTVINAFALPGGKVFITRGLLSRLTNEAQLAAVLGHECGHVTAQHMGQQMSRQMVIQGVVASIGLAAQVKDSEWLRVLGQGAQAGGTLYGLKFSRDQESQADELGVRYMTRLGYNPTAIIQVMEILKAASGGSDSIEFFQTHPNPDTRIKRLTKIIKEKHPDYADPTKYTFNADRFKTTVLDNLAKLPPAKHGQSS